MFIIYIGIRKIRKTDDSLGSGTKLLLPSLSLGFRHDERKTQFFNADCSSIVSFQLTDSINPSGHKHTGLAQVRKINSLRLSPNLNSLLLFKITMNPSPSLPGVTSFTSPILFAIFIVTSVIVISTPRTRVNPCTQCVFLTNPCTKPKGSQPN